MAQQLFNLLDRVFSDEPWTHIQANSGGNYPHGSGTPLTDVKAILVHETSGWPPRINGREMFIREYLHGSGLTSQLYVAGDGTVLKGMELPWRSSHGGFLNDQSLGIETGHGWGNYKSESHLLAFTETNETKLIPDPAHPGQMIKNPHFGERIAPVAKANAWIPLRGENRIDRESDDDVPGLKLFLRHAAFPEVVVSWFTTDRYSGPWREPLRAPEMLFTEQQYRSWALLARWLAEQNLVPRNFALLPHKTRSAGNGDPGQTGMMTDGANFAAIVLADEVLSRSPATFGLAASPVPPTAASLQAEYTKASSLVGVDEHRENKYWKKMLLAYRGIAGHGFAGDADNGDHDCPGPLFDWHRFAREVWDWWWWPFDFDTANPNTAVAARPYGLATHDHTTPLKDYYWPTPVATPKGRARTGVHGTTGSPQTFELPQNSRIYALANGELVAARFANPTGPVSMSFALVRHDVFHRLDKRTPNAAASPPIFANRIDYDLMPDSFYSLYMHLGRPAGLSFDAPSTGNPDWLNRLLLRKKECQLGLDFRANNNTGKAIPLSQWNNRPPGGVRRPGLLEGYKADNDALGFFLTALRNGRTAVSQPNANATPINVLLGDFLGVAGVVRNAQQSPQPAGVRVEVFSNMIVDDPEFAFSDSRASGGGWRPPAGVTNSPIIRYQSEWARIPTGAEQLVLQAAGVDTALVNWWPDVQPATLDSRRPLDGALPENGVVTHYDPLTFMPWLNKRTWRSEWPKYRVTDASGGIPNSPIVR